MSKRLGGIKGCKYKTSSWHIHGFCFVSFSFCFVFTEAAALRSIVLRSSICAPRQPHAVTTVCVLFRFFFPFVCLEMSLFSEYFLYHCRFLVVWRVRRTFFPSEWCFYYLVTTGWIFYISLCDNSINQLIQKSTSKHQIQPESRDEQADAGRDCRTRLARPNSQARTRTGKNSFSLFS